MKDLIKQKQYLYNKGNIYMFINYIYIGFLLLYMYMYI